MHKQVCLSCMTVFDMQQELCPCCGSTAAANRNPAGALPEGLLLNEKYRVGAFVSIDSEGSLYEATDIAGRRPCRIKEYMPVTLCSAFVCPQLKTCFRSLFSLSFSGIQSPPENSAIRRTSLAMLPVRSLLLV